MESVFRKRNKKSSQVKKQKKIATLDRTRVQRQQSYRTVRTVRYGTYYNTDQKIRRRRFLLGNPVNKRRGLPTRQYDPDVLDQSGLRIARADDNTHRWIVMYRLSSYHDQTPMKCDHVVLYNYWVALYSPRLNEGDATIMCEPIEERHGEAQLASPNCANRSFPSVFLHGIVFFFTRECDA